MTDTRVLIATPSSLVRARLAKLVETAPGCEVIATCADLSETFNKTESHEPAVVLIAEEFCRLEEFAVMIEVFNALGARWMVIEASPALASRPPLAAQAPRISTGLSGVEIARLIQADAIPLRQDRILPQPLATAAAATPSNYDKLVVIGASTGGVDALITVLQAFPADCPPTAIVQHTGRGFSDSLVQLLARRCKPRVLGAQDGLLLERGMVCIAGGTEGHLTLVQSGSPSYGPRCQVRPGPPVSGHVPSVDMLFRSALPFAPRVVAAILTGMGQDGAAGLLDLQRAGCVTIGQDEATSVVYGMPKAAWDRGAVQTQLPVQRIGAEILRAASGSSPLQFDRRLVAR